MSTYYRDQLNKINIGSEHAPTIKVRGENMNETNWISLNEESAQEIVNWLTEKFLNKKTEETVTENELDVLQAIYKSEYQQEIGEKAIDYPVWSDCIRYDCKIVKGKSISGVMSSLVKKGLAGTDGTIKDGTCWITRKGYEIIIEKGK